MTTPPKSTQAFLQKRRLLLFIPLPSVVCLVALFYLGGGGQGVSSAAAEAGPEDSGINLSLPSAGPSTLFEDKMAAAKVPADSSHRNNLAFAPVAELSAASVSPDGLNYAVEPGQSTHRYDPNNDLNVTAVQSRIQQLQQQSAPAAGYTSFAQRTVEPSRSVGASSYAPASPRDEQLEQSVRELDQLKREYEQRLQALNSPTPPPTPATKAAVVKTKARPSVVAPAPVSVVNRLDNTAQPAPQGNSFHSLGGSSARPSSVAAVNAVPAVVHSDQVVVQGQIVKLRLLSDVQLEGRIIPQNTVVYGVCGLSGQRLTIAISSIQYENSLVPVSLSAYDLDGGEGLSIPGSVDRDAAKQGLAAGATSADLLTMSPSLGAQAAGIAIQTGKALSSKKIRLVKINLKANYKLLLH